MDFHALLLMIQKITTNPIKVSPQLTTSPPISYSFYKSNVSPNEKSHFAKVNTNAIQQNLCSPLSIVYIPYPFVVTYTYGMPMPVYPFYPLYDVQQFPQYAYAYMPICLQTQSRQRV